MQVVMITRLYAMYEQSRKILIFLIVIYFVVTITCGAIAAITSSSVSVGKS
jgi:predicted RND superfamily exporter protein